MVRICQHGYRGLCEVCEERLGLGPLVKRWHYSSKHPEIRFTSVRNLKNSKTVYGCGICDKVKALSNYAAIVSHYQECHPEILRVAPLLRPTGGNMEPVNNPIDNPVGVVDKFFDSLTVLMLEVERLRKEKEEWQAIAKKWAQRIVELQELLGRKP